LILLNFPVGTQAQIFRAGRRWGPVPKHNDMDPAFEARSSLPFDRKDARAEDGFFRVTQEGRPMKKLLIALASWRPSSFSRGSRSWSSSM